MRVFLTGGTGFIGQSLVQALLRRGWQVTALVRRPESKAAQAISRLGAVLQTGDVTDRESMRPGMTGADLVIHNAGWYEYGLTRKDHPRMRAINVTGTEHVLGLAEELGILRTVHISSIVAAGPTGSQVRDESYQREQAPPSYYEQTKAEAHEIAQRYQQRGLPVIIACPGGVLGPNDHSPFGVFLRLYLNHIMPPFAWAPDIRMSCVHVEDLAEGIALASETGRPGEKYILGGDPISRREMVKYWNAAPGGFKIRFFIPTWLAYGMFATLEPLQRLAGMPVAISRETVSASKNYAYSSAKAQRELGWTYRSADQMWPEIIEEELRMKAARKKKDLASRLMPLEG